MDEHGEKGKRPVSITVICILGFLGAIVTVPLIFSPVSQRIGAWYPVFLAFASVVGLACMIGLWMMKKWAAYTYTGFFVLSQIVLLATDRWGLMSLVIPGIVVFFALKQSPNMT